MFPVQIMTNEHHYQIQHIRITLSTKFHYKQTVLIFWTRCGQKGHFQSKEWQKGVTTEFSIFRLVQDLSRFITKICLDLCWFILNRQFWFFLTTFAPKGYFQSKIENTSITIEFSIFEFLNTSCFFLNKQFWFFWSKFA